MREHRLLRREMMWARKEGGGEFNKGGNQRIHRKRDQKEGKSKIKMKVESKCGMKTGEERMVK